MRKIVLLAVNSKYIHSSLSVWALAGGVSHFSRTEVETAVVEATINQGSDAIVAGVAAHSPSLVGVSAYIWNARLLPEILERLRAVLPRAVVVLGGPEASFNAEHWLSCGADYVLRGEGERSLPALVDALFSAASHAELSLGDIPGLCRVEGGCYLENAEMEPVQTPPDPYSPAWFGALGGRIAYLETSRGCPIPARFAFLGRAVHGFFRLSVQNTSFWNCRARGRKP